MCLAGETQPLATLAGLSVGDWSGGFSLEKRVYLVPRGKLIALLSQRQDSVLIRRFDPEEELRRSSRDYLVVASVPPGSVSVGQTFQYQIVVKAKNDKVEYRLDSGPEGMTVSPSGLVRWDVTAQPPARAAGAVVSIASGNQTLRHDFTVDVRLPGEPIAPAQPPLAAGRGTTARRLTGGIQPPTPPNASGSWELAKVDDHRLRMSAGDAVLTPGLKYQSMLFLQGNHLAVLGADGITISKTHELATTYKRHRGTGQLLRGAGRKAASDRLVGQEDAGHDPPHRVQGREGRRSGASTPRNPSVT